MAKIKYGFTVRLLVAFAAVLMIILLESTGWLTRLEFINHDFFVDLRGTRPADPKIIIVEISDYDIASIGRWPWKRTWFAALSRALTAWGARAVYFDMVCSEPASEEEDAIFEEAIKESNNVYLPLAFVNDSLDTQKAFMPIERLTRYARGVGAINIFPDKDGIMRRIPVVFPSKQGVYFQAAAKMAMDYGGWIVLSRDKHGLVLGNGQRTERIPLEQGRFMTINWLGRWERTFKHYSCLDILAAYRNIQDGKSSDINTSAFKGSICLVGVTSLGLYDIKATPIQSEYPAVGIAATVVDNILNNDFLRKAPEWANLLLILALCLVIAVVTSGKSPHGEALFVIMMSAVCFYAGLLLFKRGFFLNSYLLICGMLLTYFLLELYNFYCAITDKQRLLNMAVTDGLTGLYNINYFKVALETEILFAQADPQKGFSVIMCDVDNFKTFNDTMGHQAGDTIIKNVADSLKASVRVADIVARYGGDEMIILLRGVGREGCRIAAEKLRKNIETLDFNKQGHALKLTISVGYSSFCKDDTAASLIKRADDGLYKSKLAGRNCVSNVES